MNRRPSPAGSTGQKNPGRTRSTSCRIANSIDGVRSPRLCERHSEIDSALSRPLALTRLTPLLVSHPHRNARYEILPKSVGAQPPDRPYDRIERYRWVLCAGSPHEVGQIPQPRLGRSTVPSLPGTTDGLLTWRSI